MAIFNICCLSGVLKSIIFSYQNLLNLQTNKILNYIDLNIKQNFKVSFKKYVQKQLIAKLKLGIKKELTEEFGCTCSVISGFYDSLHFSRACNVV